MFVKHVVAIAPMSMTIMQVNRKRKVGTTVEVYKCIKLYSYAKHHYGLLKRMDIHSLIHAVHLYYFNNVRLKRERPISLT